MAVRSLATDGTEGPLFPPREGQPDLIEVFPFQHWDDVARARGRLTLLCIFFPDMLP
jgi:hypothetical protein